MSIIKLKRGNKSNLPILDNGELAFTLDTNELFIGSNNTNYVVSILSDFDNNLIINNNFYIPIYNDTNQENIQAGNKYFMGNFYITNSTVINVNKNYDGSINISGIGPFSLEYREKIVSNNYLPFNGKLMTLSFDIINNNVNPIIAVAGAGINTVNLSIPNGQSRQSFSFIMTYNQTNLSLIKILNITNNASLNFKISNIGLNLGENSTNYPCINPLYLESAALDMSFKTYSGKYRVVKITANTLTFIIPSYFNKYLKQNSNFTFNNSSNFNIYNKLGNLQTGFIFSLAVNSDNCINLIATKNLHALTDAYITIKFDLLMN